MFLWLLESTALALSIFVTTMLLWLGLTVLFNGERGKPVVLLASAGLLAAALFFFSHTMILGLGFTQVGQGMNFWWRLAWLPLPIAPYVWLLTVLRYADLSPQQSVGYRHLQIALGIGCASLILVFLFANPFPSYASLVYAHHVSTPQVGWFAGIPLTLWLYIPYSVLCFLAPALAFRVRQTVPNPHVRARPWLAAASLILMSLGVVVGIIVAWAARQPGPLAEITRWNRAVLVADDSVVLFLTALAVILLGRAIVGFEVFTERPLPRRGFFRQWRRTVILNAAFATAVAFAYRVQLPPIYSLMLTTALAATMFALFTWRAFTEHEDFLNLLRPFVASTHLREQLLAGRSSDADIRALFEALCSNVLDAQYASLSLDHAPGSSTPLQLSYHWSESSVAVRTLNLSDEHETTGMATLRLGPKNGGGDYAAEEIDVARAAVQRIADLIAGEQVARMAMDLLRRRIAQVKVLGAQNRRVLHDDVLPQLHAAILRLEARGDPEAMSALTDAHKTLSAMVRQMGAAAPERLEREGLVVALQRALEHDFRSAFEYVEWHVTDSAAKHIARDVPPFVGEVVFAAAQEAIRNAARHGRGSDGARPLRLAIEIDWLEGLRLVVRDDGVGLQQSITQPQDKGGTGSGLLFHSTMLAVVGGRMRVESAEGRGTSVIIVVPRKALTATL